MTKFIDTHHHLWDTAKTVYPWMTDELSALRRRFDVNDLAAVTEPAGVTGTILVQTISSFEESLEFLATAEDHDLILGVVAWVDLTSPQVSDHLAQLKESKGGSYLVGIRHQVHDEEDEDWLLRDEVQRGLAAIRDHQLTYDLLLRPRELPAAITAVQAMPDMNWVVDHIAKPQIAQKGWEPWASQMKELASVSPTCWVKLSGMVTEANWHNWTIDDLRPYAHHVIDVFGPDHCMIGTDWPVCLLASPYLRVIETARELISHLSVEQQICIQATNAIAAYRLASDASELTKD